MFVLNVLDPTGACHCQIMDCIIPGSVAMTKVKFDAQGEEDCKHNFSLLHEAFTKCGITRVCMYIFCWKRITVTFFDHDGSMMCK